MFRKPKKAFISYAHAKNIETAQGEVTNEPLPFVLKETVAVNKITVTEVGKSLVVAVGNDEAFINIEVKG